MDGASEPLTAQLSNNHRAAQEKQCLGNAEEQLGKILNCRVLTPQRNANYNFASSKSPRPDFALHLQTASILEQRSALHASPGPQTCRRMNITHPSGLSPNTSQVGGPQLPLCLPVTGPVSRRSWGQGLSFPLTKCLGHKVKELSKGGQHGQSGLLVGHLPTCRLVFGSAGSWCCDQDPRESEKCQLG